MDNPVSLTPNEPIHEDAKHQINQSIKGKHLVHIVQQLIAIILEETANCQCFDFQSVKQDVRNGCKIRDDIRHLSTQKLYTYELCSDPFEDSQFTNKEKKNRLIKTAIPTLFTVPIHQQKLLLFDCTVQTRYDTTFY